MGGQNSGPAGGSHTAPESSAESAGAVATGPSATEVQWCDQSPGRSGIAQHCGFAIYGNVAHANLLHGAVGRDFARRSVMIWQWLLALSLVAAADVGSHEAYI